MNIGTSRTWAEISLENIKHNVKAIKRVLPDGTRFLGVVKADAYGHGALPFALELERQGLLISSGTLGRFVTDDPNILQAMRQEAYSSLIRSSAAQFKAMGLTMKQAAEMLLSLEKEEENNG